MIRDSMGTRTGQQQPQQTSEASAGPLTAQVVGSVGELEMEAWNALVPADGSPFLRWEFLDALERSGSAAPDKGWTPHHVTLRRGDRLVAAAPGWVKTHMMGEFFYNDFQWAQVTPRFGVRYFPKLILSVPFSPATGPRLLVAPGEDAPALRRALVRAAMDVAREKKLSSVAAQFVRVEELEALVAEGFHHAVGVQYHWENAGYSTFGDFLGEFNSKRRHMLKSERAQLAKDGTTVRTLSGDALDDRWMEFASRCYEATVDRHAYQPAHLTPAFFQQVARTLPGRVELVVAEEGGRPIAAAFNLVGPHRLYGRHWGALENRRHLHFNVCYYHSIERCIADRLEAFEPGAGGDHKLARGFQPTAVHAAHWFVEPRLDAAMGAYLARSAAHAEEQVAEARAARIAFRAGASLPAEGTEE